MPDSETPKLSDEQAIRLLSLVRTYVREYDSCADMTISEMAEDLAQSMDDSVNDAPAEAMRLDIVAALSPKLSQGR